MRSSRRTLALLLALLGAPLAGCRRENARPITADPSVPDAKKTPEDAAPPVQASALRFHDGVVLDLAAMTKLALDGDRPVRSDALGDRGYAYMPSGELRAYDLKTGARLWSLARPSCGIVRAVAGGVLCADHVEAVFYQRDDGKRVASSHFVGTMSWSQLVRTGDAVILLRDDGELESRDGRTFALLGTLKFPFMPYGSDEGLVATDDGVCGGSTSSAGIEIACVDAFGTKVLRRATFALHKPTDPSGTYFTVRAASPRRFVVSTVWSGTAHRGIVVRLSDLKEELRVEEELADAVERSDGVLAGAFVTVPSTKLLDATGAVRWTSTEALQESASAVVVNDLLVVASFHRAATGARLDAFDVGTGVTRWHGLVELLPIAHSKYFNRVHVSLDRGNVLMLGNEAGQHYFELFDPNTGNRLLSDLHSP